MSINQCLVGFYLQSKAAIAASAGQVPDDQDKLLGEAKRMVDKSAFEMKSSLVSVWLLTIAPVEGWEELR